MRFTVALTTLALLLPVLGAPFTKHVVRRSNTGHAVPNAYLVVLKDKAAKKAQINALSDAVYAADDTESFSEIKYDAEWSTVLPNAYAATLKGAALDAVLSDPNVEYVEEDGIVQIDFHVEELEERDVAAEVEPVRRAIEERAEGGAGVVIYGIDTGILTTHTTFGGRASWGATFGGYPNRDGNGHGTHTAGTAVGATYGVATSATIVAVKVLSDGGSGTFSDVISGINYATAQGSGKLAIATLSLGGGASSTVDAAVTAGINAGVHFTIAAGNSNVNAANTSPARVAAANTIGAIDSNNAKASFSNYGAILDVWAPGVSILSAYIGSNTATARLSGTSMSTPYVAGVLAIALGRYGSATPAALSASLKSNAQAVVTGAPSGTTNLKATIW